MHLAVTCRIGVSLHAPSLSKSKSAIWSSIREERRRAERGIAPRRKVGQRRAEQGAADAVAEHIALLPPPVSMSSLPNPATAMVMALREKALKGSAPITVRPGALVAPADLEAVRAEAEKTCQRSLTDEELAAMTSRFGIGRRHKPSIFQYLIGQILRVAPLAVRRDPACLYLLGLCQALCTQEPAQLLSQGDDRSADCSGAWGSIRLEGGCTSCVRHQAGGRLDAANLGFVALKLPKR